MEDVAGRHVQTQGTGEFSFLPEIKLSPEVTPTPASKINKVKKKISSLAKVIPYPSPMKQN